MADFAVHQGDQTPADRQTQARPGQLRRASRLAAQTEAMTHTMAQTGWQAMIDKSARIFDDLLRSFALALHARARGDRDGHLAHLLTRVDFNGFYAPRWGIES